MNSVLNRIPVIINIWYKKTKGLRHLSNFSKERKRWQQALERYVWFRFVTENGEPYKRSKYDRVKASPNDKIIDFRDKVHAAKSDFLGGIDRSQLTVREAGGANDLDEDTVTVGERGTTKANALVVVVPITRDASIPIADENYHLIEERQKKKHEGKWDQ